MMKPQSNVLPWCWSQRVWLAVLAVIFLLRFPGNFLLHPPYLPDFEVFRAVAIRILQGDATHLYSAVGASQMVFKYAPCWALLFAPLGWLSAHPSAVLWATLSVGWLLLTCWITERLCRRCALSPYPFLAIPAVLLLVRPLLEEFLQGQANLLWGCLSVSFLWLAITNRPWRAALCLALAISLKLPALLFLPYLALTQRWKLLARTVLCVVMLNTIAVLILLPTQPLKLLSDWASVLLASGPDRAFEIGSQSLLALLGRLLRNDGYHFNLLALSTATVSRIAAGVAFGLFGAIFFPRSTTPRDDHWVATGALVMTLMVLLSPTCWVATYAALLFPVLFTLALFTDPSRRFLRIPLIVTGLLPLGLLALLTNSSLWRAMGVRYLRGESYVYLVLMILPWFGLILTWSLWHQRRLLIRCAASAGTSHN